MRRFSSYGPINKKQHYFVPRQELLAKACTYLVGENPDEGGHYITVWAPRQTGKSSLFRDLYWQFIEENDFAAAYINLQSLQGINDAVACMKAVIDNINEQSALQLPLINSAMEFQQAFLGRYLRKPLILIIDEFDCLEENVIDSIVGVFRSIYHIRTADTAPSSRKHYLLHGLALIGVRSAVGVDNKSGSPFNVQKSLQVHNLTKNEVREMYHWYEKESGRKVTADVINRIFHVTQGHPGLVSWFGELLTQKYNQEFSRPFDMKHFEYVYKKALCVEPNNTVINIISKAKTPQYSQTVLELFRTDSKREFRFEKPEFNFLYMHGVISYEEVDGVDYVKFPGQFIQEKLFDYFSDELVPHKSQLLADPFTDLTPVINEKEINMGRLLELYQDYYTTNRDELLKYAQRRVDLQVMEVVYHFQLYAWLDSFLTKKNGAVLPEFPTGNGKIDLLIRYGEQSYGLELKSFSDITELNKSIRQASEYGQCLNLDEITLVVFMEVAMPDELKKQYAEPHQFPGGSTVNIFFLVTGLQANN